MLVYVGLTEDDYDEFGRTTTGERPFVDPPAQEPRDSAWSTATAPAPSLSARTPSVSVLDYGAGASSPPTHRPLIRPAASSSGVRPITTMAHDSDLDVLIPRSYEDSKRIGDELRARRALVVNLAATDADLSRRIVDFSSGVVYTLGGKIQKVGPQVYLLAPPNVRVSPESLERLRHQNFRPLS
jgi:FtsZ-interacting cell division protein YlmF